MASFNLSVRTWLQTTPCRRAAPRTRSSQVVQRAGLTVWSKMYVPDSFGGHSPERKAADHLRNLFTFVAVRIVLSQLEGSGRGSLASYNTQQWSDLTQYLEANPSVRDGDAWLAGLTRKNQLLGVRVMEVRTAYCKSEFEWDSTKRVAEREMEKANQRILQQYAEAAFQLDASEKKSDKSKGSE